MKKLMLVIALAATTLGAVSIGAVSAHSQVCAERYCNYGQCAYIKRDGYQCQNCAQQGSVYCWSHR